MSAALHEAGHAVIAERLGLRVEKVTLAPPLTTLLEDVPENARTRYAVLALAGDAAERRAMPDEPVVCPADRGLARRALVLDSPLATETRFDIAEARAEALVRECWSSILRVTETLARSCALSGDEVRALL